MPPRLVAVEPDAIAADIDRHAVGAPFGRGAHHPLVPVGDAACVAAVGARDPDIVAACSVADIGDPFPVGGEDRLHLEGEPGRSEEHTSELQSLMRISYAVFCLKK